MYTQKNVLNMFYAIMSWVEMIVYVETDWLSNKEKYPGTAVSCKNYANSLLGDKSPHDYWFPWKKVQQ